MFDSAPMLAGRASKVSQNAGITTQSSVDVRQNFPETWLFEMELVG